MNEALRNILLAIDSRTLVQSASIARRCQFGRRLGVSEAQRWLRISQRTFFDMRQSKPLDFSGGGVRLDELAHWWKEWCERSYEIPDPDPVFLFLEGWRASDRADLEASAQILEDIILERPIFKASASVQLQRKPRGLEDSARNCRIGHSWFVGPKSTKGRGKLVFRQGDLIQSVRHYPARHQEEKTS